MMLDAAAIASLLDFSRGRLLGTLETIEKTGRAGEILGYRPGPGRAHGAWQFLHVAATDDRVLNVLVRRSTAADPWLVEGFAGGSKPSDDEIPDAVLIRRKLTETRSAFVDHLHAASTEELDALVETPNPAAPKRTLREWGVLLAWHEAHHQGQIHLTLNLFKASHGMT
ncbi:MAG: DinB family protein [Planctomycetia bacterium]